MSHDLVIRGGMVVDGTGASRRQADVAVDGEHIVAVGGQVDRGRREIEAEGLLVTPGWVDMHTHYDGQATWDPALTPAGWHGVTTVVMGNCGVGFAPCRPDERDYLIQLMEGVEDIPGAALAEGIEWEWETIPEYLDALARRRWVADVGTQVTHGSVRAHVMGERATGEANADDIARIARITAEGLAAGALGFSTSRTPLHKARDGELVPGTFADVDELMAVADAIAEVGHGVIQGAWHHPEVPDQLPMLRALARRTGRPVTVNLNQTDVAPDLWRSVLDRFAEAAAGGDQLWTQVAGRPVGILMSWAGTVHPFMAHPTWRRELAHLDDEARRQTLARPEIRSALLSERTEGASSFIEFLTGSWHKMFPFRGDVDYEPEATSAIGVRAAAAGVDPAELAFDHLCSDGGEGLLYFPLFGYSHGSLDDLREMHLNGRTRMGLADGGAHVATICDGSMPTFMISFWTRDRTRGELLPLEHVVRRQTRDTAEHYGLWDRGVIAPGYRADLNLIDHDAIGVTRPRMVADLPTGARRYVQRSQGYRMTVCRGVVVAENDELTGAHPGRLIRGPQPAPPS